MPGYTKLFGSILASTIWNEPAHVKVVWITMLAMCDQDGVVEASVPGLAVMARVDRTLCEQAISVLSAPDPDSRTKTDEGRRIAPVKGGWHVLNYEAYRDKQTAEEAKAKKSARQARWRARHPGHVDAEETPETQRDAGRREETHSEAEASAKAASKTTTPKIPARSPNADSGDGGWSDDWLVAARIYGDMWVQLHGGAWQAHAANRRALTEGAYAMRIDCNARPCEFEPAVRASLTAFFDDSYAKAARFPLALWAKNPLKYQPAEAEKPYDPIEGQRALEAWAATQKKAAAT